MDRFVRYILEDVTTANTIDWQAEYQKYNVELFDGILPVIPIELKNIKPHGVCISFHYNRGKLRVNRTLSKICISTRYKQTHEQFMNTLIHEMIHAWLCVKQVPEREHHGLEFKSKMYALRKLGFNIDVHAEEGEIAVDNKRKFVVFLVEKLATDRNKYLLVSCSPKNADAIKTMVVKRYMREPTQIYHLESTNNIILKYPTARTKPKYYIISKADFDDIKSTGTQIDYIDNSDPNMNEKIKATISHNPEAMGTSIKYKHNNETVLYIPMDEIVSVFEGADKTHSDTASPESIKNVEKIKAGINKGHRIHPIVVRKFGEGYQVLDGHHRYQAHKDLGMNSIRAIVVRKHNVKALDKPEDFQ